MNQPAKWGTGEPISARKLNGLTEEATLGRTASVTGPGSAMIGDNFGLHAQHHQKPSVILVEAQEDFEKGGYTDNYQALDEVTSGWCLLYRFDKSDGSYKSESGYAKGMFRVWDTIGQGKKKNDTFYAVFNKDSQRLEVLPGVDLRVVEGLCVSCLGNGWYEVELGDFPFECGKSEEESCSDSGSGSDSASESSDQFGCDLCEEVDPELSDMSNFSADDEACTSVQQVEINKVRPLPRDPQEIVCAHDARSLPIKIGGHVRMLPIHKSCDGEQLYAIISAEYEMIKVPTPDWECCDGEVVMTACNWIIVEGKYCTGWTASCPSNSGPDNSGLL